MSRSFPKLSEGGLLIGMRPGLTIRAHRAPVSRRSISLQHGNARLHSQIRLQRISPRSAAHTLPSPSVSVALSSPGPSWRRYASDLAPSPSRGRHAPPMPLDQPREDYTAPTLYTLSYLSRVFRLVLYTALGLGATGLAVFEGWHVYIEKVLMATPAAGALSASNRNGDGDEDAYGWVGENVSWTGRERGGTDPRLGWKARHALRAAWVCQEYGAGGSGGSIARERIHPQGVAPGQAGGGGGGGAQLNRTDRGYELAEEYIDLAIGEARRKGFVFPDSGPSAGVRTADETALDLLLLKAGVLERLATPQTLRQARGIYEDVLSCIPPTLPAGGAVPDDAGRARRMRLANKIGDLAQRTGGSGVDAWLAGLAEASVDPDRPAASRAASDRGPAASTQSRRGWFSWGASPRPGADDLIDVVPASANQGVAAPPPAVQRAALTLLVSLEASQATSGQLDKAARTQAVALSLIPPTATSSLPKSTLPVHTPASPPTTPSTGTLGGTSAQLHASWLAHRRALITLHSASVAHAQKSFDALGIATSATAAAETLLPTIPTYQRPSALAPAAKILNQDAHALAAEANYIKGLLLERLPMGKGRGKGAEEDARARLEGAAECFEKALGYVGEEKGGGGEWARYWKGFARVKGKLDEPLALSPERGGT